MADDLPPPPVPSDADLTNFAYTPLYRARLFGSAFHAKASDAEWRGGLTLWLKSQDQRPAGSLPDDDTELCRLAELGRNLRAWRKIKSGALHGWYRCSDGRLYHKTVAETVREQWDGKIAQRLRTLKARIAAIEIRLSQAKDERAKADLTDQLDALRHELSQTQPQGGRRLVTDSVTGPVTGSVTDSVTATKGIEGKGIEGKVRDNNDSPTAKNVISLPARKGAAATDGESDDGFREWYGAYPRRKAPAAAEKAYRAARKVASAEVLLAGAQAMRKAVEAGRDLKYVPYPATWLNGERWLDEADGTDERGAESDDVFAGAR